MPPFGIFRRCDPIIKFWHQLHMTMQQMVGNFSYNPTTILLCDFKGTKVYKCRFLMANMLTAAAQLICRKLEICTIPSINHWCYKILKVYKLTTINKCYMRSMNALHTFQVQWYPFVTLEIRIILNVLKFCLWGNTLKQIMNIE